MRLRSVKNSQRCIYEIRGAKGGAERGEGATWEEKEAEKEAEKEVVAPGAGGELAATAEGKAGELRFELAQTVICHDLRLCQANRHRRAPPQICKTTPPSSNDALLCTNILVKATGACWSRGPRVSYL